MTAAPAPSQTFRAGMIQMRSGRDPAPNMDAATS